MGRRPWIVVALAAVLAAMLVPGSAVSVVQHSDDGDSVEFDVRTGVAAPTSGAAGGCQTSRGNGDLEPVRNAGLAEQAGQVPRDRHEGCERRRGCTGLAEREQGHSRPELDRRPRARCRHATGREQRPRGQFPPGVRRARGGGGRPRDRRGDRLGGQALEGRVRLLVPHALEVACIGRRSSFRPQKGWAQAAQAAGDGFSIATVTQAKDAAGYGPSRSAATTRSST